LNQAHHPGRLPSPCRYFSGRVFRAAPGRAVPFAGTSPFLGARFAAPVFTAGRVDPDCCPLRRLPPARVADLVPADAPPGPSRRGPRSSPLPRALAIHHPRRVGGRRISRRTRSSV